MWEEVLRYREEHKGLQKRGLSSPRRPSSIIDLSLQLYSNVKEMAASVVRGGGHLWR